jgi:hypothetical protein
MAQEPGVSVALARRFTGLDGDARVSNSDGRTWVEAPRVCPQCQAQRKAVPFCDCWQEFLRLCLLDEGGIGIIAMFIVTSKK